MSTLALRLNDVDHLRRRVTSLCENRPGVYRMSDPHGNVIYVGKAKRLRTRLLTYFRWRDPAEKAAKIIQSAADLTWSYTSSEFSAHLTELREIQRFRPRFNVRMNHRRNVCFIRITVGPAPKLLVSTEISSQGVPHYGPLPSPMRVREAVRVLNDSLGLRDCALDMTITYPEQGDLFGGGRAARCMRHEIGTCLGPCAGLVSEEAYRGRVAVAREFLDGRSVEPIGAVVARMEEASRERRFEIASRWRDRFEALEWLFAAQSRTRATIEALSFVYLDPGSHGDDRAYVIRRATVRGSAPAPRSPIEREAFRALVAEHVGPEPEGGPAPVRHLEEMILLQSWFRRNPSLLRRTVRLQDWLDRRSDGSGRIS